MNETNGEQTRMSADEAFTTCDGHITIGSCTTPSGDGPTYSPGISVFRIVAYDDYIRIPFSQRNPYLTTEEIEFSKFLNFGTAEF
jgi:hypothetical protein